MGELRASRLGIESGRSVCGRILGVMRPGSVGEKFWVERFCDLDGRGEDAGLDNLKLGVFAYN